MWYGLFYIFKLHSLKESSPSLNASVLSHPSHPPVASKRLLSAPTASQLFLEADFLTVIAGKGQTDECRSGTAWMGSCCVLWRCRPSSTVCSVMLLHSAPISHVWELMAAVWGRSAQAYLKRLNLPWWSLPCMYVHACFSSSV